MEAKKIEKLEKISKNFLEIMIMLLDNIVNVFFKIIVIIGSLSAILLLHNMFPEVAAPIMILASTFSLFIFNLIKINIIFILLGVITLDIIILAKIFKERKKNNEAKKKKFMDDLAKKISKEMKKN